MKIAEVTQMQRKLHAPKLILVLVDAVCRVASGQPLDRTTTTMLYVPADDNPEAGARREKVTDFSLQIQSKPQATYLDPKPQGLQLLQDTISTSVSTLPLDSSRRENSISEFTATNIIVSANGVEEGRIPLKLFGVPLHDHVPPSQAGGVSGETGCGNKRPHADVVNSWEVDSCGVSGLDVHRHDLVFPRAPPLKCLKSELAFELRPSSAAVKAPWLQICASRDEGVYIWDNYSHTENILLLSL